MLTSDTGAGETCAHNENLRIKVMKKNWYLFRSAGFYNGMETSTLSNFDLEPSGENPELGFASKSAILTPEQFLP